MTKCVSQVLHDAREALYEHGWWDGKNARNKNRGTVCVMEAVALVSRDFSRDSVEVSYYIARALDLHPERSDWCVFSVPQWNDERGRTFNQITDTLERAEKFAEIDERRGR